MTWPTTRIDRVADEVRESVDPSLIDGDVTHWSIPALDATGGPLVEAASSIGSAKMRLRGGEVLVSRLNPRKARVVSVPTQLDGLHVCSGEFVVLRPRGVEARFLEYLLLAESTRQLLDAHVQSVTRSHQRIRPELVRHLQVPMPSVVVQRAIADYLDVETARIDALIAKKVRLMELLSARRWLVLSDLILETDPPQVPLRRALTFITDGPFGSAFSSSEYSDAGVAVVRLGNIGFAEWRGGDLAFLPENRFREFSRHRVEEGDLLIAGLGDATNHAGRACVAPDLGLAIVKGKGFCARVDTRVADPTYLSMYCSSPLGADAISVEARGSTRSMINLDIMKSMLIRLPGLADQQRIARTTTAAWSALKATQAALKRQIDRLHEHRQALITAAVTGEVKIPGMAA